MKKHVDVEHFALMRKLIKCLTIIMAKAPLDQQASKKKAHVFPSTIFRLISINKKFRKNDPTHVSFLEDLMLFMAKGHYKKSQLFKRPT